MQHFIITGELLSDIVSHCDRVLWKGGNVGNTQVHYIHWAFSPYSLQKSYLHMQVQGTYCVRIGTLSADFSLSVQSFKSFKF